MTSVHWDGWDNSHRSIITDEPLYLQSHRETCVLAPPLRLFNLAGNAKMEDRAGAGRSNGPTPCSKAQRNNRSKYMSYWRAHVTDCTNWMNLFNTGPQQIETQSASVSFVVVHNKSTTSRHVQMLWICCTAFDLLWICCRYFDLWLCCTSCTTNPQQIE